MTKRSKKACKTSKSATLKPSNKRMSSEDFLKKANKLWKEGPAIRYKHPDAWQRTII